MKKLIEVFKDSTELPNEEAYRQQLLENVDRIIDSKKLFCATVEAMIVGLIDSRLDTQRGTMDALNEYHKYLAIKGERKYIWMNHAKDREGFTKIYFEV